MNLDNHCQKGFIGERVRLHQFRYKQTIDLIDVQDMELPELGPQIYYMCGVTENFNWKQNFHLAFVRDQGAMIDLADEKMVDVLIHNASRIPIIEHADNTHPNYSRYEYRTCRNWQFAYDMVEQGILTNKGNRDYNQTLLGGLS